MVDNISNAHTDIKSRLFVYTVNKVVKLNRVLIY